MTKQFAHLHVHTEFEDAYETIKKLVDEEVRIREIKAPGLKTNGMYFGPCPQNPNRDYIEMHYDTNSDEYKPMDMFIKFVHEFGHHLSGKKGHYIYELYLGLYTSHSKRTIREKCKILSEEIRAWSLGFYFLWIHYKMWPGFVFYYWREALLNIMDYIKNLKNK